MLIIMGIRAALELLGTTAYTCEVCGRHTQHEIVRERKKFSLFFIPLFSVGRPRYLDICSYCGRALEISAADAEAAAAQPQAVQQPPVPQPTPGPQDAPAWTPQDRR
jgi:zinc-ribbon family